MKFSSPTSSIRIRENTILLKSTHNLNATYKSQTTQKDRTVNKDSIQGKARFKKWRPEGDKEGEESEKGVGEPFCFKGEALLPGLPSDLFIQ